MKSGTKSLQRSTVKKNWKFYIHKTPAYDPMAMVNVIKVKSYELKSKMKSTGKLNQTPL